jgi:hypothetical protein
MILKRPKNAEDLPSPLLKRRKRQEKCNWGLVDGMTLDWTIGQFHGGLVRGSGCLCSRREVGQWVLVLVGGVDGAMARQEDDGGVARKKKLWPGKGSGLTGW